MSNVTKCDVECAQLSGAFSEGKATSYRHFLCNNRDELDVGSAESYFFYMNIPGTRHAKDIFIMKLLKRKILIGISL